MVFNMYFLDHFHRFYRNFDEKFRVLTVLKVLKCLVAFLVSYVVVFLHLKLSREFSMNAS